MNKAQLKIVKSVLDTITKAKDELEVDMNIAIAGIQSEIDSITSLQETLQGEYDEMSETLQEGEKGEKLTNEIDKLGEIVDSLSESKDTLEEIDPFTDAISTINELIEE